MKQKRYIAEKPEVEELFWIQSYKKNFALKKTMLVENTFTVHYFYLD